MIMSRLKHSTLAQHLEVEALMPVLHPGLTLPAYAGLLTQIYAAVQPLEAGLQALTLPEPFELPARLKTPLLVSDLQAVSGATPAPRPPLRPQGVPEALGVLYVLEGATLGGQVIGRHLNSALGLTPETGAAYFHAYGARTGTMWKAFTQAMNREVPIEAEERVIGGAQTAFEAFRRVLAGTPA
ncbi:heme oxygenase [Deinococcus malanensis]|uniref:Heme oxygenase n=1 Tax=Deinococcus malanensis TaxID=1706855 RepID=A0ABQ2ENF3_9DEIO|nr:biliverdin-producing heme oxygenase [Deinococcus malanensis]GGK18529.1 heme oxygenase [Deinococcus malanensis]